MNGYLIEDVHIVKYLSGSRIAVLVFFIFLNIILFIVNINIVSFCQPLICSRDLSVDALRTVHLADYYVFPIMYGM